MSKKPFIFIDAKYVASFAIRFFGIALVSFIFLVIILFAALNRRLGVGYLEDISTLSHLQERMPVILIATGVIQAVVFSFVLLLVSLFWAHEVSGPLVRFRKYLSLLGKGQVRDEMKFRNDDQLHHLAAFFRQTQTSCKIREDRVAILLNEADKALKENKPDVLKKIYKKMREVLRAEDAS